MNLSFNPPKPNYTYDVETSGKNEIIYFDLLHVRHEDVDVRINGFRIQVRSKNPQDQLNVLVPVSRIPTEIMSVTFNNSIVIIVINTGGW